jgi:hypothetical protein
LAAHLLNPHIVRVRDFAMLVDHVHAVVELVSEPGGVVKPLDDVVELLRGRAEQILGGHYGHASGIDRR